MVDLEADPVGGSSVADAVIESVSADSPASDAAAPAAPETPSTPSDPLADLYDFGPPGEDQSPAPAAASAPPSVDAAVTAPAEEPAVSDVLRQRAAAIGYTPEFMSTFKDPTQLEMAVLGAERAALAAFQVANQQRQAPAPVQQPVQQQAAPAPQAPPPFDENAFRQNLKNQNYDEGLAELLVANEKRIHEQANQSYQLQMRLHDQDRYNRESHQFMLQKEAQIQAIQAKHQQELIDRDYADFTRGLSEAHQKLVSTPEAKAQVIGMANTLLAGMAQSGQRLPSNTDAFKQAMFAVLGDKLFSAATEQVRQEVRVHQGRSTSRPASSSSRPVSNGGRGSVDGAARFSEDFFRKMGMPSSDAFTDV